MSSRLGSRVAVVGAGIIGLSTAVHILESQPGVTVTLIADKFSPQTTGDGAAGIWLPHAMGDTDEKLVRKWGRLTLDRIRELADSEDAADTGAFLMSGYLLIEDPRTQEPFWSDIVYGFRRLSDSEMNGTFSDFGLGVGWAYTTGKLECTRYLPWMLKRFCSKGGKVVRKKVKCLSELACQYDVVVNCAGLGAEDLMDDKDMQPIRGQLIYAEAPWLKHFVVTPSNTYAFPGIDHVVLGGCHQEGNYDNDIDEEDSKIIFERCCRLIPSLKKAKVLRKWVGLRPGRTSVRLEKETIQYDNKTLQVVHNYGHGGAGITLHWGCAQEAAKLVAESIHKAKL